MRPGRTAGDVFAAHARVFDAHGLSAHRLNACGYSLGAKFTPVLDGLADVLRRQLLARSSPAWCCSRT